MKIVQIVTQMEAAGAQKVAHLLHEGLKTHVDSELWFLYTKRAAYAGMDGVKSLLDHPPKLPEYAVIVARLYRWLRDCRPDFVMTHTHYSNILGQPIALAAGVPRRIAVHHNPLATYPTAARIVDRVLGRNGTYSEIVAVSESVTATLRSNSKAYLDLVTMIHNGLIFPEADPTLDARARWGIPNDAPLLVAVGRLSKQKNHALLLHAMRELPGAHLAIVGEGELRSSLTGLTSEFGLASRVHFTGELPPSAVGSLLNACSVFVFPSLWEGLPMAAIEALHAGAVIVASDIPATREVVADAAVLVPPGDAAALASAIRTVLRDPILAHSLSHRAKRRAKFFTASTMIERYCQLLFGDRNILSPAF